MHSDELRAKIAYADGCDKIDVSRTACVDVVGMTLTEGAAGP